MVVRPDQQIVVRLRISPGVLAEVIDGGAGPSEEVAGRLELMKDGVERAGTELVAVPAQLSDESQPIHGFFARVVEDVDLDEAEEELAEHVVCDIACD